MCKMIDQYADKIKGRFSFFDRMIINGYFRPPISEQTRTGCLYSMGIPMRDFTLIFQGCHRPPDQPNRKQCARTGTPCCVSAFCQGQETNHYQRFPPLQPCD